MILLTSHNAIMGHQWVSLLPQSAPLVMQRVDSLSHRTDPLAPEALDPPPSYFREKAQLSSLVMGRMLTEECTAYSPLSLSYPYH